MELISLKYAIFVIVLLVLYYCFPKKYRWYVLLAGSMAYYVIICKVVCAVYHFHNMHHLWLNNMD